MGNDRVPVPTVLIADDDPDLVALMKRRLLKGGYLVITASDGEEALRMAEHSMPHLILLDVMMPKLTGIDVLGLLRAIPATRDIPVVVITAGFKGEPGSPELPPGADGYLKKPFGPHEPLDQVKALLALSS